MNSLSRHARAAFTGAMPVSHTPIEARARVAAEVHAFCRDNDAPAAPPRTLWASMKRLLRAIWYGRPD